MLDPEPDLAKKGPDPQLWIKLFESINDFNFIGTSATIGVYLLVKEDNLELVLAGGFAADYHAVLNTCFSLVKVQSREGPTI